MGDSASPRFPSPFIEPELRISRLRHSDWPHPRARGGRPSLAGVSRRHRGHVTNLGLAAELARKPCDRFGVCRQIANHRSSAPLKARRKSGPFPPPALPCLSATMALSDSRPARPAHHGVVTTVLEMRPRAGTGLPGTDRRVGIRTFTDPRPAQASMANATWPSKGRIGHTRRPDDFKSLEHGFDRVAHLKALTSCLDRKVLPVSR